MSLNNLPNELILRVAEYLKTVTDINALHQANTRYSNLLTRYLYKFDVRHNDASACYWAAESNQVTALQRSLDAGAQPRKQSREWETEEPPEPLHPIILAARAGSVGCVRALLACGVDPSFRADSGDCALLEAVEGCHIPVLNLLLESGADIFEEHMIRSPFMLGYRVSALPALEVLFEYMEKNPGRYAEAKIREGAQHTLHAGGSMGSVAVVRFALEKGASVNLGRPDRAEPVHPVLEEVMRSKGGPDLNWTGSRTNVLVRMVRLGNEEIVRLVLENGADVQAFGGDALILALCKGYRGIARVLVEKGADVNVVRRGWAALEYAMATGDHSVAEYLRENGAKEWKELRGL